MSAEKELIAAVRRGNVVRVAAALAAGPNDRAWTLGIIDAVHVACKHGRLDCLRLLLAAGADPNATLERSWELSMRPIHRAVQAGHPGCVAALLDAGADPCATCFASGTHDGTPLHLGSTSAEVVRLLLRAAPQTAAMPDLSGRTPLHLATGSAAVAYLLFAAAPQTATMRCHRNLTPLDTAIEAGSGYSVQLLLAVADLQPTNEITDRLIKTLVRLDRDGDHERLRRLAPAVPVFLARLGVPLNSGDGNYTFERYRSHMDSPTLARWLPAMLRRSNAAAARLVPFLPPADRQRLRTLALCLVRYQRSLSARLPAPIAGRLLAQTAAQHALRVQQQQQLTAAHRAKLAKWLTPLLAVVVAILFLMRTYLLPKHIALQPAYCTACLQAHILMRCHSVPCSTLL